MKKPPTFSPEVRLHAVHMVLEHCNEHPSQWAAIEAIAGMTGCMPQALYTWVKKYAVGSGLLDGVSTEEAQRIKDLECEAREQRKVNAKHPSTRQRVSC